MPSSPKSLVSSLYSAISGLPACASGGPRRGGAAGPQLRPLRRRITADAVQDRVDPFRGEVLLEVVVHLHRRCPTAGAEAFDRLLPGEGAILGGPARGAAEPPLQVGDDLLGA